MNHRHTLTLVITSLMALPATAQLLPGGVPGVGAEVLPPVEQGVNRQVERIREGVNRQTETVQRQVENAADTADAATGVLGQTAQQAEQAVNQVANVVLDDLPSRLSILDVNGDSAFVEVSLEPGVRAVEYEWVMILDEAQRAQLEQEAPDLMDYLEEVSPFSATDGYLLRFLLPPELDADNAVLELIPEDLRDFIDRNHIYSAQQAVPVMGRTGTNAPVAPVLALPMSAVCSDPVGIGMVDSLVNHNHDAFGKVMAHKGIVSQELLPDDILRTNGHGTAVAAILVGEGPELSPLLPAATLYSAPVLYSQDDFHQGATVMHLLKALNWLLEQNLSVINMSLTGPPNRLLESTIKAAAEQGKVVVAAAGNDGPYGPPRYPAAYDGVIAVSATDQQSAVYRWSSQGPHIAFSALGVSVPTARGDGSFGRESGTSISTPIVSAFLACAMAGNGNDREQALQWLRERAVDLGAPGKDPVFGYGLLHP